MRNKKFPGVLKSVTAVFITGIILLFPLKAVFAKSYIEVYSYEMEYDLNVPNEYKDHMVDIGTGTLNIQFNDDVYFSLKVDEYYNSLTSEERGKNDANDYSMGRKALDDTYNNLDFVTEYFNTKVNTIIGKKRVVSIEQKSMNGSKYWICSYVIYTESTDPQTQAVTQTDVGEGRMYLNMTKGLRYFIVVNSSNGLLSETPDALKTVESFDIGRKSNPAIILIWLLIIACIVAFIWFLNNKLKLFTVEVEDEEGHTIMLSGIRDSVRAGSEEYYDEEEEFEKYLQKINNASEKTISLKDIREMVQNKIDDIKAMNKAQPVKAEEPVLDFNEEEQLSNNKIILEKLDILLERHAKGKGKQKQPVDNEVSNIKNNEEILNDLDEILGRNSNETES